MYRKFNKILQCFSYVLFIILFSPSMANSTVAGSCRNFSDLLKAPVECVNLRAPSSSAAFKQEGAISKQDLRNISELRNSRIRLAGWLNKLTGDKEEKGGASKGLGGLFKSLKTGLPSAGTQSANQTQGGSSLFSQFGDGSSDAMDFICTKHKKKWAYDYPAPDTSLLAGDFKVPVDKLAAIFKTEFYKVKYVAVPNPQNFENGFDSLKIKELFLKFLSEKTPEILSQFKQMGQKSSSMSHGMKVQADAQFAYGLILLQFSDFVSNPSLPLSYIKRAWQEGQRGANYVWGALIFHGEAGMPRDVNKAANFVANANAGDEMERSRGGEDAEPFEPFPLAANLLVEISKDPAFKHKAMYALLRKDAEKFKRKWIRKRNTGSTLYRQATHLNYKSVVALEALAKALGLGEQYGEALVEVAKIKQDRNPNKQLVERSQRVKEELQELIAAELKKTEKLDADQIDALQKTADANRLVIIEVAATVAQLFMSQMAAGGMISPDTISDWGHVVPIIVKGKDTACDVRQELKVAYLTKQEGGKTLPEDVISQEEMEKAKAETDEDIDDDE